jgi:hypothetical protein
MTEKFRDLLDASLLPYAEALYEFEAPATQTGTPAGSRKDYLEFHRRVGAFLSELSDRLADEYGGVIIAGYGGMHWRKIVHGRRVCYMPCAVPSSDTVVASIPEWLACGTKDRAHFSFERELPAREAPFEFKGVIGLREDGCPPVRILTEYVTGKSSKGEKMDGNAHERLSYKLLQYLELYAEDATDKCELFVFGNGAFAKYSNRFYPFMQRQFERMAAAFPNFKAVWAVEVPDFLALGQRIVEWLGERPPIVVLRRQGLGRPRGR